MHVDNCSLASTGEWTDHMTCDVQQISYLQG